MTDTDVRSSPRAAAGEAMRTITINGHDVLPWDQLAADRRELWGDRAAPAVTAALDAVTVHHLDQLALVLYIQHHRWAGTYTDETVRGWEAGEQHVDRWPWRHQAQTVMAAVALLVSR
jgi:hypothetical protein